MKKIMMVIAAIAAMPGCTWVKLDDAGGGVRVVYDGRAQGCRVLGEIGVSVKDKVGFYERNDLKVKDELETLARNEAASMHADTIAAKGEPRNGEQGFTAYACGAGKAAAPYREPAKKQQDAVETFPVKEH